MFLPAINLSYVFCCVVFPMLTNKREQSYVDWTVWIPPNCNYSLCIFKTLNMSLAKNAKKNPEGGCLWWL